MPNCNICPRQCNIDRNANIGYCGTDNAYRIARYSLHMWEEPCISGQNGSGTIFFTGCNLKCIYCQNSQIALKHIGKEVSEDELVNIMLKLQDHGAHNINLVTPSHYIHMLPGAILSAKKHGLQLPIVYNTSSYERVDALKSLDGLIDIYLPDLKYLDENRSRKYSNAPDYPSIAKSAIDEMYRQAGKIRINEKTGLLEQGVVIRHLVLPLGTKDSKNVVKYVYETYNDNVYLSIMNQYTPIQENPKYQELNRKVTHREYDSVIDFAINLGMENVFIQEGSVATESFIPPFSNDITTNL